MIHFKWKLGLSATPDRAYDAAGNVFIETALGKTLFKFPLESAIQRGVLSEFDYLPLPYDLTDGELRLSPIELDQRRAIDGAEIALSAPRKGAQQQWQAIQCRDMHVESGRSAFADARFVHGLVNCARPTDLQQQFHGLALSRTIGTEQGTDIAL
jgi:superfamily II DNA or RNA helicase